MTVIRDAVAALCDYCEAPSQEKGDFVKTKEKEADAVRRELVEDINRTFITPHRPGGPVPPLLLHGRSGRLRLDHREGTADL